MAPYFQKETIEGITDRLSTVRDRVVTHYKRFRKGFVYVITSDKVIQSVLTGSVVSFILSVNEGVSAYVQLWVTRGTGVFVPVKIIASVGVVFVFVGAYYADQHTEEWREFVESATGEEASEDTAAEEDVTGEEKEG